MKRAVPITPKFHLERHERIQYRPERGIDVGHRTHQRHLALKDGAIGIRMSMSDAR